ncbi:MAG: hypothetical protein K9M07_07720 [Simkaniaceae bacterium]|nr:hypothetical protein [Simkaniaceae bacterium]
METTDDNMQLRARVAALESKLDHLEMELIYLNQILIDCGFPHGVQTLKETVEEVISENSQEGYERARRLEDQDLSW